MEAALIVILLLAAVVAMALGAARARTLRAAPWEVVERTTRAGDVLVELRREGHPQSRVAVGRVPHELDAAEFADRLAEVRSAADDRRAVMNAGIRQLGR